MAQIYGVHPTQITQWKKQLLDQAPSVFGGRHTKAENVDVDELYKKIGKLEIFNSDQGSQITSEEFTSVLKDAGVAISMDGVGRAIDNVSIERLWRTLKYDHIYLNPADSGSACRAGIAEYLRYYNEERSHLSLGDRTPDEVYYESRINQRVA